MVAHSLDGTIRALIAAEVARQLAAKQTSSEWVPHVDLPGESRRARLALAKRIGCRKVGRLLVVKRADLEAYLERCPVADPPVVHRDTKPENDTVDDGEDLAAATVRAARRARG